MSLLTDIIQQLPISHTNGEAKYETTVETPIADLAVRLLAFDTWHTWSPYYTFMRGEDKNGLEAKKTDDEVHPQVITNGQSQSISVKRWFRSILNTPKDKIDNEEELYSVEGGAKQGKLTIKYKTGQYANPHVKSIKSEITLEDQGKERTKITWKSVTELNVTTDEKFHSIGQAVGRVIYDFIGPKLDNNGNFEAFKAYQHPLDELVKAQTNIYAINCLALPLNVVIHNFKDKGFDLINHKLVSVAGQVILGNNPALQGQYGYAQYGIKNIDPDNLPKMCAGIPVSEVLPPKKFARLLERLLEMAYLQVASLLEAHNHGQTIDKINFVRSVETLSAVYGSKQDQNLTAHLAKKVGTDEELCQQLLQGVNPLMIEWVRDINKVPESLRNVTITDSNDGKEISVEKLFAQKRLFIVDYGVLHGLEPHNEGMYFHAPWLLLYREDLPNNTNRLNIVAIQLKRTANAPIYQKKTCPKNLWALVKMFVTSADNNVHEFGYHLGLSHLAIEPICVATHNQLPKTHAIRSLLQPHLDETIGINFLARNTLVDSVLPFTDKTFVIGTNNGCIVASKLYQEFSFFKSSFPQQLASRGFTRNREDGLTSYYYRDDGFRLWDCLGNYAANVVNTYYKQDSEVLADKAIQNWAQEMSDPTKADVRGFPTKIETKEMLTKCLQVIIWNGSAFHSVINYSQWPYIGFINNRPNGLYRNVPEGLTEITEDELDKSLAGPLPTLFQILFPWLLSAPISEDNLPALRAMNGDINQAFQDDLKALTNHINDRNKQLELEGKTPYVFCLPENIACSVSI